MFNTRKLCAAAALALCAALPTAAMAQQKVLYLSTAEGYTKKDGDPTCSSGNSTSSGSVTFIKNAINEFKEAVKDPTDPVEPYKNLINRAGALSTDYQIARSGDTRTSPELPLDYFRTYGIWDENDFKNLGAGDVVVVQTAYQLMDPDKATVIAEQIKTRKDLTFILLLDTCNECSYDTRPKDLNDPTKGCVGNDSEVNGVIKEHGKSTANLDAIMDPAINESLGWGVTSTHLGNATNWTAVLDPYKRTTYDGLLAAPVTLVGGSGLMGNTSGSMQCTPQQNVLFPAPTPRPTDNTGYNYFSNNYISGWYCNGTNTTPGNKYDDPNCTFSNTSPANWPELNASSSFGLIVPFWQSNHGEGACIYLGQDNNLFDGSRCNTNNNANTTTNFQGQCGNLVSMFLSLAAPNGACHAQKPTTSAFGKCTTSQCVLAEAEPKPDSMSQQAYDETLAVLTTQPGSDGEGGCGAKIWCDKKQEDRASTDTCNTAAGENHKTHCCRDACNEGDAVDPTSSAYDGCYCKEPDMTAQDGLCCPTVRYTCGNGDDITGSHNGCGCVCDPQTMVEENGICVPRQPVCQAGELLSSGCVCDPATMVSHEGRCKVPVCQEDQSTTECALCDQPLQDQDGVCRRVSTTCNPPSGCSSAPTTGWPALLGFGALLPLLAARRRQRK